MSYIVSKLDERIYFHLSRGNAFWKSLLEKYSVNLKEKEEINLGKFYAKKFRMQVFGTKICLDKSETSSSTICTNFGTSRPQANWLLS